MLPPSPLRIWQAAQGERKMGWAGGRSAGGRGAGGGGGFPLGARGGGVLRGGGGWGGFDEGFERGGAVGEAVAGIERGGAQGFEREAVAEEGVELLQAVAQGWGGVGLELGLDGVPRGGFGGLAASAKAVGEAIEH